MSERTLEIDNVSKEYRLGAIGAGTLHDDLRGWLARRRGKEDPNRKIGDTRPARGREFFLALNGVSLSAERGDALAIVGRNGAGKSTLLKLISRITAPTSGEIRLRGRVSSLLEIGTGFHQDLTGRENIYLNGAIQGMRRSEIAAKLSEIIEFSEIEQFIDTPVKRYSSGMYIKLAFAVAAHLDPDILICDEVLAGDEKTLGVRFPMDSLAPGEYSLMLSLVGGDPRGNSIYYDTLEDVGHFIIVDDPTRTQGFVWSEPLWGNMRLRPLELEL